MLSGIRDLEWKRVKMQVNARVPIHRRLENSQLGMQIVQKWLRKTIYGLCRSCRGLGDLQLCYSPFGPLLLKILEQNAVEQGQVKFFRTAAHRVRAHARRRARGHASSRHRPTGHNRWSTATTTGPTAPHRRPHPNPRRHAFHILRPSKPMVAPPYFACTPAHVTVRAPCCP
jgi:hypothetical protein